jgi:hypothetical protein
MSPSLRPLINEIVRATREHDLKGLASAAAGVPAELPGLTPAELTAGIGELVPELTANAMGPYALIAGVAAALVEAGGSPMPMREALPERAFLSIYPAVAFPDLWKSASGGRLLAAPGDQAMLREMLNGTMADVLKRIGTEFRKRIKDKQGTPADDQAGLILALEWYDVLEWVQCLRISMQDREFRVSFPAAERDQIQKAARALKQPLTGGNLLQAAFLEQVALVLDDEPLVVIDPASQRGFRLRISGIGDNEQLYTLLAAFLSEHGVPGIEPPRPSWLDDSAEPTEQVYRRMRLFDGQGKHVHPKDWPADMGLLDGTRVVVVHPADECHWRKSKPLPVKVPSVVPDSELGHEEVADWLGRVTRAREDNYSLYREKTSFWRGNQHGHAQLSRVLRLCRCGAAGGLGSGTTAQADSHRRQACQGDHRAGHSPERNTGHSASTHSAHTLEREDDPCQRDQQAHADEQNPLHDGSFFLVFRVCGRSPRRRHLLYGLAAGKDWPGLSALQPIGIRFRDVGMTDTRFHGGVTTALREPGW